MITQFRFENYKSFQNVCQIDFMASSEKFHENHYVEINGQKILTTIAFHGNNASGKSTCISAIKTMGEIILYSLNYENISEFEVRPFRFSKISSKKPTMFEIFFVIDNYEYQYGFVIDTVGSKIQEEWLYKKKFSKNQTKSHLIFERNDKKIITENKVLKEMYKIVDSNILFVTLLGKRHIKDAREVYNFFRKFSFYTDSKNVPYEKRVGALLKRRPEIKEKLEALLEEIDPCIKKLEIKENNERFREYQLFGVHKVDGEKKAFTIPLIEESEGTIKCIRILPYIIIAFLEGGTIIIDEFDARFHPLVYRKIISLFYDKDINIKNAQLLFTSHSTFLFNSSDMRRDQIFFVEKNSNGVSDLYSLADFEKLRSDANYEKKYLAGEFGSIPFQNKRNLR